MTRSDSIGDNGYHIDEFVEFDVSNHVKNNQQTPVLIGDICFSTKNAQNDGQRQNTSLIILNL